MQYGHFDDRAREYVITRPDTPAPWVNYLGSPEYGAIISNNAGGYSFARSGANGRILRYVFNQFDQPGRYLYLRDDDSGDFWSASWQPVGKDLAHYRSRCCHGVGYTRMLADYAGISSEANERFSPYNHSGRHIFMPPAVRFSIGCGNSARQGLSGPAGGLPHPSCVGASGSDSMFHSTI